MLGHADKSALATETKPTQAESLSWLAVNSPEKISQLIIGMEGGTLLPGEVAWMMKRLKHEKVKQASQIRASVIAEWTKRHDVRIVQYMCGHKYLSATERYQSTHLDELQQQQLKTHHPLK